MPYTHVIGDQFSHEFGAGHWVRTCNQLGGRVTQVQVSRVDLHADFIIAGGLSFDFIRHHLVSKSKKNRTVNDGDDLETFYLGKVSNSVQLRIYNKSKQIKAKPDLRWLFDIYKIDT